MLCLFVSAPPSSIEMVNHTGNSKIEIRENEEFQLECLVKNSKPVAKIVWYRGQVELKLGNYVNVYYFDAKVPQTQLYLKYLKAGWCWWKVWGLLMVS